MPVYDTPLHTNDQSLDRVLQAGLPVALVLWDSRQGLGAALEAALNTAAAAEAGSLLVARLDTANNPRMSARWSAAGLPALVGFVAGQQVLGPLDSVSAEAVHSAVDYLLGRGEKPAAKQASGTNGTTSAWTRPVTVTDASFQQEVLESPVPVVVDFWAPWCGPCRMIGPALERIAAEFGGRVKIAKVNVDEHQRYAGQYGVQGIPTLLVVKEGRVVDRLVGALPESALRQRIRAFVS